MNIKKLLEIVEKLSTNECVAKFTQEELEKLAPKFKGFYAITKKLFDVTEMDAEVLQVLSKLGIIKVVTFAKRKVAKLSKWAEKLLKNSDAEELKDYFTNLWKTIQHYMEA